jgi:xanthine dehydrogenase YagT iron-sulfur-binding subunit
MDRETHSTGTGRSAATKLVSKPMELELPAAGARSRTSLRLRVNGLQVAVEAATHDTLLDVLRGPLRLTGVKAGCGSGGCGACTVLANSRRILACLALARLYEGHDITTIEGIGSQAAPHPLQAAFVRHDALQCGFCTPGQIVSAVGYLAEGHANAHERDVIREQMSGNLCRCGAYPHIVSAIAEVAAPSQPR